MKTMLISTLTAAVFLSGLSTSFAVPKQTVQEPIYFTLATGGDH